MPFTATMRLWSDSTGRERERRRERRRHDAVEQQARPDEVVPHALVAQQRGAVGRVTHPGAMPSAGERRRARASKRVRCSSKSGCSGIVGGRKVRVDGVDPADAARGELRASSARDCRARKPRRFMPGVDLQMTAEARRRARAAAACERRAADRRRDGRRQVVREDAVEIADAQRAEDEDRRRDARPRAATTPSSMSAHASIAAPAARARSADRRRAVTVGIRLDDGDDPRRPDRPVPRRAQVVRA